MFNSPITVTSPLMAPLDELEVLMREIWQRRHVTNKGPLHERLEAELAEFLGVPYISLFTNGTLPLMVAFQALGLQDTGGEVITTPYSFVATTNALRWCGLRPVFADVDPLTGNLSPERVEASISEKTVAILPVHVYGTPCDIENFESISRRWNLPVIYDAAHAFGVRRSGRSLLLEGALCSVSFHATKTFNTLEGGALVSSTAEMKNKVDLLRNFGFAGETSVIDCGINGKMDELRAAVGLVNLRHVTEAISLRSSITTLYRQVLADVPGIRLLPEQDGITSNFSYFPIFVDAVAYGETRDALYERLKRHGILSRRYFYPLISNMPMYSTLPSAQQASLPIANLLAAQVLCLPLHHALSPEDASRIAELIAHHA